MGQKRAGWRSCRKCPFKAFFDVGDIVTVFPLSLEDLFWHEVLVRGQHLIGGEGAFVVLEGAVL